MSSIFNVITLEEEDIPGAKLNKAPSACSVDVLKRWLQCHGQKRTGNKRELVSRVEGFVLLKTPVDPKVDGGKWYTKKQQLAQDNLGVFEIVRSTASLKWTTFPNTNIPLVFNEGHIYRYLIEEVDEILLPGDGDACIGNGGSATNKSKKKGEALFTSGFVENAEDSEDEQYYYARAHVHHSMKNDVPLQSLVTISKMSGYIKHGSCTCVARALERCCHIAALLSYILAFIKSNGYIINQPSTSLPCTWNHGKKRRKNPKALHKAIYESSKRGDPTKLYSWDPRPECERGLNVDRTNAFISSLQSSSSGFNESMWETVLETQYSEFDLTDADKYTLLMQIDNFEKNSHLYVHSLCDVSDIVNSLLDSVVHNLPHVFYHSYPFTEVPGTKMQSESESWLNARWPLLTASDCKVVHTLGLRIKEGKYCQVQIFNYLNRKLWETKTDITFDMVYGINHEPVARQKYMEVKNAVVKECGLFMNKRYHWLGASPDGIVFENGEAVGIIEIKCLKVLRERPVSKLIDEVKEKTIRLPNCLKLSGDSLELRTTHGYYYQIQLQLIVTELEFCDFVIYSQKGPPFTQRIFLDRELKDEIIRNTYCFWKRALLPEYFIMKVPRKLIPIVI